MFTAVVGLLSTWVDRKVGARVQWRVGPPFYQPFADIFKLLGKEIIVPEGISKATFLLSPIIGLAGITIVGTMLWLLNMFPKESFVGDLIVVIYLLVFPSIAAILGGSSSRNPLAALGSSREMKLVLGYELPFLIAVFTVVLKAKSILFRDILMHQATYGPLIFSPSCILAALVALLSIQAKLALPPFDIPEAEQEIMAGPYIEYSGAALAIFKLTRAMMLFVLPTFLITLYLGGIDIKGLGIIYFLIKYIIILTLIILIKNTNPRLRIDQAVKFFWGPLALLSLIGFLLANIGI